MAKNLEIPLGKRTAGYRFLEILPGALSYTAVILLFILSWINPMWGAVYILLIVAITLVKAVAVAFRTVQGYKIMKQAEKVNWSKRLDDLAHPHESFQALHGKEDLSYGFDKHVSNLKKMAVAPSNIYPDPQKIYNAVIMVAYDEGLETLVPSVEAVRDTTFDNKRIIFVLGYEERGGEAMEKNALELKKRFKDTFYDFLLVKHPDGIKGEIKGKGPNLTYAGEHLSRYVAKKRLNKENIIVTSLDSDNRMSREYLAYLTYEFVVHEERQRLSYQPVSLFMNNIWDAPAPMRIIAISNSFFNIIMTMRPHALRNFASHAQPLKALEAMGFWSKRTIVEDGHQYWRSLFFFKGDYEVLSIRVPMYQDAVLSDTLGDTLKAQFIQLRRWAYGASDVAYVGSRLFDRIMPFWLLFSKFLMLLDGHVTLAVLAPIVAFGGWVPMVMNLSSREMVAYSLPNIVGIAQTIATIGLMITIVVSLRMLPERPKRYKKGKTWSMVLQWFLMPVVAIVYQSFAAFYSQTRLLIGKYMEKFDVTKKAVRR